MLSFIRLPIFSVVEVSVNIVIKKHFSKGFFNNRINCLSMLTMNNGLL